MTEQTVAALPPEEMKEVLALPDDKSCKMAVLAKVDLQAEMLTLVRGDLASVTIPLSYFRSNPTATPDFNQLRLDDHGMSLGFGKEYEAAVDTILRWTGASSPKHRATLDVLDKLNNRPNGEEIDLAVLACGKMFRNTLGLTGGKKEVEITDIERLLLTVKGNRANEVMTLGDLRQLTEATIRWCGERLGMQVDY